MPAGDSFGRKRGDFESSELCEVEPDFSLVLYPATLM